MNGIQQGSCFRVNKTPYPILLSFQNAFWAFEIHEIFKDERYYLIFYTRNCHRVAPLHHYIKKL